MKLKKLLCTALSAALLGSVALAGDTSAISSGPAAPEYEITQTGYTLPIRVWGSASELEEGTVRLQNASENETYRDIVLNITEETAILDAVTGEVKTYTDLREGETIYAYVSAAMTRSLPPISNAELILCGIPADYHVPSYAEVQGVSTNGEGKWSVLMSDDVVLHLNADTVLSAFGTKDIPTLERIVPGARLLSWYSVVFTSMPAQATPDKVVVFPSGYEGYAAMVPGSLHVNGSALSLADRELPYAEAGKLMVPVRALAEALGYTATWEVGSPARVLVEKDGQPLCALTIGDSTMVVEGDMVMDVTTPAVVRGGVTFLAAEDLVRIHSLKLTSVVPF